MTLVQAEWLSPRGPNYHCNMRAGHCLARVARVDGWRLEACALERQVIAPPMAVEPWEIIRSPSDIRFQGNGVLTTWRDDVTFIWRLIGVPWGRDLRVIRARRVTTEERFRNLDLRQESVPFRVDWTLPGGAAVGSLVAPILGVTALATLAALQGPSGIALATAQMIAAAWANSHADQRPGTFDPGRIAEILLREGSGGSREELELRALTEGSRAALEAMIEGAAQFEGDQQRASRGRLEGALKSVLASEAVLARTVGWIRGRPGEAVDALRRLGNRQVMTGLAGEGGEAIVGETLELAKLMVEDPGRTGSEVEGIARSLVEGGLRLVELATEPTPG